MRISSATHNRRKGTALPLLAISMVGLMGFIALSIDIGVMAIARTQAQAAADIAALAGARTLDGKTASNNSTAAITLSKTSASNNSILNTAITTAQVTPTVGIYRYNTSSLRFESVFNESPGTLEAYGVMQVRVTTQQPTFFARVLGVNSLNIGATATAVHRPRDVAVVLDFSGSMGYSSLAFWPPSGNKSGSLNPDSRFPRFGPWSIYGGTGMVLDYSSPGTMPSNLNTYTPPTPMQRVFPYTNTNYLTAPNNFTIETPAGKAIVDQFVLSDNATRAFVNSGSFPAFTNVNVSTSGNPTYVVTPAPDTFSNQSASGFVGDKFPLRSGQTVSGTTAPAATQYAHTVWRLYNTTATGAGNTTYHNQFEANGHDWDFVNNVVKTAANRFQGFTMGPGYYGKTFYMWPPDPRMPSGQIGDSGYVAGDWRRRFFQVNGSSRGVRDNSLLWNSSGRWRVQEPGSSTNPYVVNYTAVLEWLRRGPQTLPASLRCGRVLYYNAIPTSIPMGSNGVIAASATADQRFWKDYIDFVIGSGRYTDSEQLAGASSANSNTGGGGTLHYNQSTSALTPQITSYSTLQTAAAANGINNASNTSPIKVTSSVAHGLTTGRTVTIEGVLGNTAANGEWTITVVNSTEFTLNGSTGNGSYTSSTTDAWKIVPYMHYGDSPVHPRQHFWFGPYSMMCYMQAAGETSGNWLPGNCYEAQCWQLKAGINAAVDDIRNNHPNDLASLIFFSSATSYNNARVSMGKSYTKMKNCLYYPYNLLDSLGSSTAVMRPYNSSATPGSSNPSGLTDNSDGIIPNSGTSTCPQMGFMVAYNQLSNSYNSSTATAYTGRKTASKIVIFETDGIPNHSCAGSLSATGGHQYTGMTSTTSHGESTALNVTAKNKPREIVRQIVALNTANPPGFSTSRNPARVHAIAFGDLFETVSTSSMKGPALRFLCAVQIDGNTSPNPGGSWDSDSLDYNANYLDIEPYKLITGTANQRVEKIREALERIMQGGVQIALIQ
jgi:hypothetical protein